MQAHPETFEKRGANLKVFFKGAGGANLTILIFEAKIRGVNSVCVEKLHDTQAASRMEINRGLVNDCQSDMSPVNISDSGTGSQDPLDFGLGPIHGLQSGPLGQKR